VCTVSDEPVFGRGPTWRPSSSCRKNARPRLWEMSGQALAAVASLALLSPPFTAAAMMSPATVGGAKVSVVETTGDQSNAVAESFFATIKRELITTRAWRSVTELRRAVFNYIEGWYNTRRLHSSLSYLSPAQWEAAHGPNLTTKRTAA